MWKAAMKQHSKETILVPMCKNRIFRERPLDGVSSFHRCLKGHEMWILSFMSCYSPKYWPNSLTLCKEIYWMRIWKVQSKITSQRCYLDKSWFYRFYWKEIIKPVKVEWLLQCTGVHRMCHMHLVYPLAHVRHLCWWTELRYQKISH